MTGKSAHPFTFHLEKGKFFFVFLLAFFSPFLLLPFSFSVQPHSSTCVRHNVVLTLRMADTTFTFVREWKRRKRERRWKCSRKAKDPLTLHMAIRADTTSYPCTSTSPERQKNLKRIFLVSSSSSSSSCTSQRTNNHSIILV